MQQPLISIVIPVHNRVDLIGNAIESCLSQTYGHFEILLVDDGSSDDPASALAPFAEDGRVRLVRHERNRGVSAARNSGVKAASGDFVAFLDSDDSWHAGKLDEQMACIDAAGVSDFICGTLTEVRSNGRVRKVRPGRRKPANVALGDYLFVRRVQRSLEQVDWQGAPLMDGCFAQTSSFLLPTSLALATPFRTTLDQYEDLAFLIDLDRKRVPFLLVEKPLTVHDNDDRPGRLGARDDLARGRRFLEETGDALSQEARLAFEATHLAHLYAKDHPLRVVGLTLKAFGLGLIGSRSVIGILSRSLLGQARQEALRDRLANRLAGRSVRSEAA